MLDAMALASWDRTCGNSGRYRRAGGEGPMKILVTGSAGHLGEVLMRSLESSGLEVIGVDIKPSLFTRRTGSIAERAFVARSMQGVAVVLYTATLHKPHIATHTRQEIVDTIITGTLNLLEKAVSARVKAFAFTSTTSVFGHALVPSEGAPAAWISEEVVALPKNIYGVAKLAAENLCEWMQKESGVPCIILRTSRFFPEEYD
jgi:nucleoside-diphosphate-sugar epimerase